MIPASTLKANKKEILPDSTLDTGSIEMLYDKHAPILYGFILRIVKDEFIADEALLECFSRIKKTNPQHKGNQEHTLRSLLHHARQVALEKINTRQYRYELLANELYKCRLYLNDNEPSDLYEEAKKIASPLPETSKAILDQLYFNGLSFEEIAAKLSLTQEQVKDHLAEAMSKLRSNE